MGMLRELVIAHIFEIRRHLRDHGGATDQDDVGPEHLREDVSRDPFGEPDSGQDDHAQQHRHHDQREDGPARQFQQFVHDAIPL